MRTLLHTCALVTAIAALSLPEAADAGRRRATHESPGHLQFTSPQVNPLALSPGGGLLLVVNTTSNTVDAVDTASNLRVAQIGVGLEPSGVAFRPDGLEAWVTNHVSDSVSVIDTNAASPSYLEVIETIQSLDANGATLFDEPTGVAFASNTKAFVALSSRNEIAIVDATSYSVTSTIAITAQDPRAIAVRNGRLYVAAFESGNQSELSVCGTESSTNAQCTLSGNTLTGNDLLAFATNPNIPGEQKNIVIDPQVPDRDLFVFDASTNALLKTQSGVGTLLYGVAVDSTDRVYVTQTDARNDVNGIVAPAASRQDPNADGDVNLADLANLMFRNEVAILNCAGGGSTCSVVSTVNLDGGSPAPATSLATPYGVAVSNDGTTVVGTAAGTNRLFTMNSSGTVLARLDVGPIPKGLALRSDAGTGAPLTAYVLNSLGNTVNVVNVTTPAAPSITATINVGADPTPDAVRLGAIAFNNAFASNTGTFSCGSCHPDGNTDQLLWRIGGECFLSGCVALEDEPRSTMPVRGLRDTVPLHWDGTLGDPFGGGNGAVGSGGSGGTGCTTGDQHGCFRDLVDASLSGVMCAQVDLADPDTKPRECNNGPSGLPGLLTDQEREDMATFLERVSYPPARSRAIDDATTATALAGFEDFFMDQGGSLGSQPDTCADSDAGCHELPLGAGTNSETLNGFDVPTMRGMTDRFLQFSIGPTGAEEILVVANGGFSGIPLVIDPLEPAIAWSPAVGMREITTFGAAFGIFQPVYNVRPLNIFQMFEEASTGHSGATGRQVTLNTRTTGGALLAATDALLLDLEAADERGVVNLRGNGLRSGNAVVVSYLSPSDEYQVGGVKLTHAALLAEAQVGTTSLTLTAHLRSSTSEDTAQPLLAPIGANCGTGTGATGDPALPSGSSIQVESKHVAATDTVFVNGQPTAATITVNGPATSCTATQGRIGTELITISGLSGSGMRLLQVKNASGLLSNELPLP
jgi:YVTN family beta-propeller protein